MDKDGKECILNFNIKPEECNKLLSIETDDIDIKEENLECYEGNSSAKDSFTSGSSGPEGRDVKDEIVDVVSVNELESQPLNWNDHEKKNEHKLHTVGSPSAEQIMILSSTRLKKPSGAECRKMKNQHENDEPQLSYQWKNLSLRSAITREGTSHQATGTKDQESTFRNELQPHIKDKDNSQHVKVISPLSLRTDEKLVTDSFAFGPFDFNDPSTWPPITDTVRYYLVMHGLEQKKDANSSLSESKEGRHLSEERFKKRLPNGEKVDRKWLLYSTTKKSLFCFPCMLFLRQSSFSKLDDPTKGFSVRKSLNTKILEHENSSEHRKYSMMWKELENKLKGGKMIDHVLQKTIADEKEKWRNILKVIVDVVMFSAKNNLSLGGSSNVIGDPHCDIFFNIVELISHYNPQIAEHVKNVKDRKTSASYFSRTLRNEVIALLGGKVRQEILSRITKAKYYSLMFDTTPNQSHKEQMTEIIRYVQIEDGECKIKEIFLRFIESEQETSQGIATEIGETIKKDGINLQDCRGLGFNNGSNMAGKYNEFQAYLTQENKLVRLTPCSSHTLNLVGVHAAQVNAHMVVFFGTLRRIFNFFSMSTSRWDALMKILKITLKGHSDTCWPSKKGLVHSLHSQLRDVYRILQEISRCPGSSSNAETVSNAILLLKEIDFKFICLLGLWNRVLCLIDSVNGSLQTQGLTVRAAAKMLQGLLCSIQHMRGNVVCDIIQKAKETAERMSIELEFPEKRNRKVKCMSHENGKDGGYLLLLTSEQNFVIECNSVIDSILNQIQWRYEKMADVASDFEFLAGSSFVSMDVKDLRKCAAELASKYSNDLDALEFSLEVDSFKSQATALEPNLNKCTPLDILNILYKFSLTDIYPNLWVALRIFLTLPVTVTCESSFRKVKLIGTYLKSNMDQEHLSDLAIIAIENNVAGSLNYNDLIDEFASLKAREMYV